MSEINLLLEGIPTTKKHEVVGEYPVIVKEMHPNLASFIGLSSDFECEDSELGTIKGMLGSGLGGTDIVIRINDLNDPSVSWRFKIDGECFLKVAIQAMKDRIAAGQARPPIQGETALGVPYDGYFEAQEVKRAKYAAQAEERKAAEAIAKKERDRIAKIAAEEDARREKEFIANAIASGLPVMSQEQAAQMAGQIGIMRLGEEIEYRPPNKPEPRPAWIAPDGRVWSCEAFEHRSLGDSIALELYGPGHDSISLEEKGWIKHSYGMMGYGPAYFMTGNKTQTVTKAAKEACFAIMCAYELAGLSFRYEQLKSDWERL